MTRSKISKILVARLMISMITLGLWAYALFEVTLPDLIVLRVVVVFCILQNIFMMLNAIVALTKED